MYSSASQAMPGRGAEPQSAGMTPLAAPHRDAPLVCRVSASTSCSFVAVSSPNVTSAEIRDEAAAVSGDQSVLYRSADIGVPDVGPRPDTRCRSASGIAASPGSGLPSNVVFDCTVRERSISVTAEIRPDAVRSRARR